MKLLVACLGTLAVAQAQNHFVEKIKPALEQNCGACHSGARSKGAPFLKATSEADVDANRGLWRNVATQMRNRTMPPVASKLTEEDRLNISTWIDDRLRQTACNAGDYAGASVTKRLNRREYHNTIRDLLGLDLDVTGMLPADGTGGAGFDTNGETLYIAPTLMERYMTLTQQILDRVIVTPAVSVALSGAELTPNLAKGKELEIPLAVYNDGVFDVLVALKETLPVPKVMLKVDGAEVGQVNIIRRGAVGNIAARPVMNGRLQFNLTRGSHTLALVAPDGVEGLQRVAVQQHPETPTAEKRALHYRLLGIEPGEKPLEQRKAARRILEAFVPQAFRRPVDAPEIDRFMVLYDRAAERRDPYEERVKLTLKGVLLWPEFLFRVEKKHTALGIYPLGQHELASRLSYFLWSTAPDQTLLRLADQARLQDTKVLTDQVDRMLDDARSRAFVSSFIGQWLGTQDVGGRVVPLLTELQTYYTPETAADLRAQPVLMMDRLLGENRSVLELLTGDYMYMTRRLAKFYEVEDKMKDLEENDFKLVQWPDDRRAGVLAMGGVLAMTSRYKETSPVLRGAWVLETLLGTPVPPPPPDVPPLPEEGAVAKLSMREKLEAHRANQTCATCHRLMDPIGLGLENFDWMGRWREKESDGKPVNASGELPSGEKFNGPVELRNALMAKKDDFVRNLTSRLMGYALGRSLQDGDSCTVQRIVQALEKDGYRARTLIREIVLSVPFRNTQGGVVHREAPAPDRTINISGLNATKQDAASHNNAVKVKANKP